MADRRKALVIDDEPLVCRSVKKILAIEEIDTDIATSGREGLVMARNSKYDMLLVDVKMPEMNGYEASKSIRKIEKERNDLEKTIIIAMTAHVSQKYIDKCFENNMDDYITKPLKRKDLFSILLKWAKPSAA